MRMPWPVRRAAGLFLILLTMQVLVAAMAGPAQAAADPSEVLQGRLVYYDVARRRPFQLDLVTGRMQALPVSPVAQRRDTSDSWYAGPISGNGELVRIDPIGNITYHDGRDFSQTGGIDMEPLRQMNRMPKFYGARLSGDGRYLLGYWELVDGQSEPRMFVMTRAGGRVEGDSPLRYRRSDALFAIDWLPDGRYVYLAGDSLVVARPGAGVESQVRLALPSNVGVVQGGLWASPDGRRVLLLLPQQLNGSAFGALFVVNLDGSGLRQLTRPSDRMIRARVRLTPAAPTWSPDGRHVAFLMRGVNPGVYGFASACGPVFVLPVDGPLQAVDDLEDVGRFGLVPAGRKEALQACHATRLIWTR